MPYTRSYKSSSRINHIDNNSCGGVNKEGLTSRSTNFMMGAKKNHVFRGKPFVDDKSSRSYECNACVDVDQTPTERNFKNIANYTLNATIILDEDTSYSLTDGTDCGANTGIRCPGDNRVICGGLFSGNNWTYARGKLAPPREENELIYSTKRITVKDNKIMTQFNFSGVSGFHPHIALGEVHSSNYQTFLGKTSEWMTFCTDKTTKTEMYFKLNARKYHLRWEACTGNGNDTGFTVSQYCPNKDVLPKQLIC